VNLGSGSSVREGIASNRDVLGSRDGAPLANVNTRVGQGFMRGDGGNGTGGDGGGNFDDCVEAPRGAELPGADPHAHVPALDAARTTRPADRESCSASRSMPAAR